MENVQSKQQSENTQKSPIANLAAAYVAAWGELQNVVKNAQNPHFGSNYASLDAVIDVVKPVFERHGLALLQAPGEISDGNVAMVGVLMHRSGETIQLPRAMAPMGKGTAQAVGSVITYLRRYVMAAVGGVAQVDDDGNSASEPAPRKPSTPASKPKAEKSEPTTKTYAEGTDDLIARIKAAKNIAELEAIKPEVQELGDAKVAKEYVARKSELKAAK